MDERVLGDVPSEGNVNGRRFGTSYNNSNLRMRSSARNVVVFATAVSAVIAFSIFYPLMQYSSQYRKKVDSSQNVGSTKNVTFLNGVKLSKSPSNCSTQIFSFGQDCAVQPPSQTEDESNFMATQVDVTTPVRRKFDAFDDISSTNAEEKDKDIEKNLDEKRDFLFNRTGRSKWPVVSTPYPYYKPSLVSTTAPSEEKIWASQETNIFAIPYDLSGLKNQDNMASSVNFTPPPYVFTPYPNFTDSYAQLSPYKVPQNSSNIYQVTEYLNKNIASKRLFTGEHLQHANSEQETVMKVSGTYIMPLDRRRPGEIILTSSSDNVEEARPFFNGHAYVSDPFNKYRPTNPADINRLIPVKSSLDSGPRFRKPVSFVPTSAINVDITKPASYRVNDRSKPGSHTVAVFHRPAVVSQKPPRLPTPSIEGPNEKPLSVVLDIYPVTVESESDESSGPVGRERGRLNTKWKPTATERPKWRPQAHRKPTAPAANNHMVVHLNLFPNKRKPYSSIRRNRPESSSETSAMTGGQFESRSSSGAAEDEDIPDRDTESSPKTLRTSSDKFVSVSKKSEFSALKRSNKEDEETTTVTDTMQNTSLNISEENTIDNDNIVTTLSTLKPAVQSNQLFQQTISVEEAFDKKAQIQSSENLKI